MRVTDRDPAWPRCHLPGRLGAARVHSHGWFCHMNLPIWLRRSFGVAFLASSREPQIGCMAHGTVYNLDSHKMIRAILQFRHGLSRTRGYQPAMWGLLLAMTASGCASPSRKSTDLRKRMEAYDPAARIQAIVIAADQGKMELVPALVDRLDDEDGAVRLFAIVALERLTGERMDYSYAAPANERRAAIEAWRRRVRRKAALTENKTSKNIAISVEDHSNTSSTTDNSAAAALDGVPPYGGGR